jgi:hypothetical protein
MQQQEFGDEISLEPVQKNLLITLVEASRNTPTDERQKFLVSRSDGCGDLIHPTVPEDKTSVYIGDIEVLDQEGLIALGYSSKGTPRFDVTPRGFKYYEYLKGELGEPVKRIEETIRNYLKADSFAKKYPKAYEKWNSAEGLLWKTDSKEQLTLIGHLCREAVQEFSDCLISAYNISDAPNDKTKTVAKLKAVIEVRAEALGNTKRDLLEAIVVYWGTVNDLIQRQEHDSQKEGKPLIWEDARIVVFQTLIVMFEIDKIL